MRGARQSEFDHVAARQRCLAGDDGRSALGHVPRRVLLHVGILRRHAIDRHDDFVAALRGAAAGADDDTLRQGGSNRGSLL